MSKIKNLLKLFGLLSIITLVACNDDNGLEENNKQSGEPYKFRIEVTSENPDIRVNLSNLYYNTYDKNGRTNPVSITSLDDYLTYYASPRKIEFDVPRNFDGIGFSCRAASDIATVKIFVNDKLFVTYSDDRNIIIFFYQSGNKFLVDINYKVAVFEFDKID